MFEILRMFSRSSAYEAVDHTIPTMELDFRALRKELDFWMEYKTEKSYMEYCFHRSKRLSFHFPAVILLFTLTEFIPSQTLVVVGDMMSGTDSPKFVVRIITACLGFIFAVLVLITSMILLLTKYYYARRLKDVGTESSASSTNLPSYFQFYSIIFSCSVQFTLSMVCIRRCLQLNCFVEPNALIKLSGGGICFDENSLGLGLMYNGGIMLLVPIFVFVGISNVPVRVIWFNLFVNSIVFLVIALVMGVWNETILVFFTLAIISASTIADLQYRGIIEFAYYKRMIELHASMDQMKMNTENVFREEMRVLVGNVAHDIKSPLTSFVTGIEYIENVLLELGLKLSAQESSAVANNPSSSAASSFTLTKVADVQSCLKSLRSTYCISLAIINRSIDFYQSAIGKELQPRLEFVSTKQALLESFLNIQFLAYNNANIQLNWKTEAEDIICIEAIEKVKTSLEGKDYLLHTDHQWLKENLICVLSNAVKFGDGKAVTVTIESVIENDYSILMTNDSGEVTSMDTKRKEFVRFGISDGGEALSDEALGKFFRFNPQVSRFTGGIGLGLLTLAKRIDALGGKYGVNRRRDGLQGTEVWFCLPCETSTKNSFSVSNVLMEEYDLPGEEIKLSSKIMRSLTMIKLETYTGHVLIVDDSAAIIKMLSMMFKKLGYTVSTAMHGKAAVELVEASLQSTEGTALEAAKSEEILAVPPNAKTKEKPSKIDIILMDIQMPIMNGFEAMKCIRQLEAEKELKGVKKTLIDVKNGGKELILENAQPIHAVESTESTKSVKDVSHQSTMYSPICIIAMSANSEFSTYQDAVKAGADAFLNKPFTMELFQITYAKCRKVVPNKT